MDVDLIGNGAAEGAIGAADGDHERAVERVLLLDLDLAAGDQSETVEEGSDLGIGGSGDGDDRPIARLEAVERRQGLDLADGWFRDRKAVRARGGSVESDEDTVLDFLRELVFEARGQAIGFVPRIAEHVREEPFDDSMATDAADRSNRSDFGQLDGLVRHVVDKSAVGESFHAGGDGARAHAERLGQIAGVGFARATDEAVDALEHLAF